MPVGRRISNSGLRLRSLLWLAKRSIVLHETSLASGSRKAKMGSQEGISARSEGSSSFASPVRIRTLAPRFRASREAVLAGSLSIRNIFLKGCLAAIRAEPSNSLPALSTLRPEPAKASMKQPPSAS